MSRLGFLGDIAAVAVGGALGSVLRYALMLALPALPESRALIGTLAANVLGCLAIGALGQWVSQDPAQWNERQLLLLRVGLLGGLTTFSTFAAEAWMLGSEGRTTMMLFHLSAHLLLGFAAFWLGTYAVRHWAG